MKLHVLMAMGLLLTACKAERSPNATNDPPPAYVPACPAPPTPPTKGARPDLRAPRLTSLSLRASSLVDVAPGHAPDAEHPAGTVFVAAVLENQARGEATLFEWDVASASAINPDGRLLYRESDKADYGKSAEVRIATTRDTLFAAVTLEHGHFAVFGRTALVGGGSLFSPDRERVPPMKNVSIETDGRWVALAYERTDIVPEDKDFPQYGVLLYDAVTMKRVTSIQFPSSGQAGVRSDILELIDGRLFAAHEERAKTIVTELALPSLKELRKIEVSKKHEPKHFHVQLTSTRGHLVLLSSNALIELTPDLAIVSNRELHADEVAVGPAGELLTPLGLEAPGRRGDFVADAHASASCTPAWAAAYPLLACTVDMDGIRIARLAAR